MCPLPTAPLTDSVWIATSNEAGWSSMNDKTITLPILALGLGQLQAAANTAVF